MKYPFLDLYTVNEPYMPQISEAMERVLHSGRYVGGPECAMLEENMCRLTGAPRAVGVSNGLDALRLILRGYIEMGVMAPGDEVLAPANTYIASILAITDAGLVPVLVDADEITLNINTALLEEHITPRTRAIMTVHLYGRAAWDETLVQVARKYNLKVIEDNAQAIGAQACCTGLHGGHIITGALGDAAAFSFYPTKNIGALGDAGAVTTFDAALADVVRALANYGSNRRYHNLYQGFNCRLDPLQAAVLNVKLPFLDREIEARRAVARVYDKHIKNEYINLPQDVEGHVYHQYVVRTPYRELFMQYLANNGVGCDIHYATPPYQQPCYRDTDMARGIYPVSDAIAATCVSLPISSCTSVEDAAIIAEIINEFQPF